MFTLPEPLSYLQDALDDLAGSDPGEIDESFDTTRICIALKGRIHGIDDHAAAALLASDKDDFDTWLLRNPDSNGHFLSAYISSPDALVPFLRKFRAPKRVRAKRAPRVIRWLSIAPPPGFSYQQELGGLFLQDDSRRYGISTQRALSKREIDHLRNGNFATRLEPVSFGPVTGYRMDVNGATTSFLLKVEGKDVCVYVSGDPGPLESVLHTLRYVDPT